MNRRIAAAAVLALCLCIAPPSARGPRPPAAGWDLFAAERLLGALGRASARAAFAPDAAPPLRRAVHATPEPGAGALLGLGLAALGRLSGAARASAQRPRAASARAGPPRR